MAAETAHRKTELKQLLKTSSETITEARDFLRKNGVSYNLGEWITPKRYCEKFGIANIQTITNWIRRGVIPSENVVILHELNDLKLIKAIPYQMEADDRDS